MTPLDPIVEALACRLSDNMREAFEERAGIFQFEAGRPRELAEPLALLDVLRVRPLAFLRLTCLQLPGTGKPGYVLAHENTPGSLLVPPDALPVDLAMAVSQLGGAARLTPLDVAPKNR